MKNRIFYSLFAFVLTFVLLFGLTTNTISKEDGAPVAGGHGNTGSPWDAQSCARVGCHPGSSTAISDAISSDIPATGYVAGQTYTITVSLAEAGRTTYGFQVSPHDNSGNLLGTLVVTDAGQTKLVGSGNYVTHRSTGVSSPTESKEWSFDWEAPAAGTGDVTFFGGFNAANGNGMAGGDLLFTSSMTVSEDGTSSIDEIATGLFVDFVGNPVQDVLSVGFTANSSHTIDMSIFSLDGKLLYSQPQFSIDQWNSKISIDVSDFNDGMYLLQISSNEKSVVKKMLKQ